MYRKVEPGHPVYTRIQAAKAAGQWVCDAYDHNEWYGCSNPECFNHKGQEKRTKEPSKWSLEDMVKLIANP